MNNIWHDPNSPPVHSNLVLVYTGMNSYSKGVEFGYYYHGDKDRMTYAKNYRIHTVGWWIKQKEAYYPASRQLPWNNIFGNVLGWMEIPDWDE